MSLHSLAILGLAASVIFQLAVALALLALAMEAVKRLSGKLGNRPRGDRKDRERSRTK